MSSWAKVQGLEEDELPPVSAADIHGSAADVSGTAADTSESAAEPSPWAKVQGLAEHELLPVSATDIGTNTQSQPGSEVGGTVRAEAYGPSQGEYTKATLEGPKGNKLVQGDYAVSPDLAQGHKQGEQFQFQDSEGNWHTGTYNDLSYKTGGHPNTRTIEAWNGKDMGTVKNMRWLSSSDSGSDSNKPVEAAYTHDSSESTEPDLTNPANKNAYQSYDGTRPIKGIILHSTDGDSVSGDLNTLEGNDPSHKVSVHYLTAPDGKSYHLVRDNDVAYHAGKTAGKLADLNNSDTIGIEQTHIDGKPWSDAQVRGTAHTVAQILLRHPELTIDDVHGHSDIAPERKQDPLNFPWDDFKKYVSAEMEGKTPVASTDKAETTKEAKAQIEQAPAETAQAESEAKAEKKTAQAEEEPKAEEAKVPERVAAEEEGDGEVPLPVRARMGFISPQEQGKAAAITGPKSSSRATEEDSESDDDDEDAYAESSPVLSKLLAGLKQRYG